MSMQNLAIVFGPTLFGQHTSQGAMSDTPFQNQVRLLKCQNSLNRGFF